MPGLQEDNFMAKIQVSSVVPAPVERLWEHIRDFNSLPKWFPGVIDSHIEAGAEPNQPGCVRNFCLEGCVRIREQMLTISDQSHEYKDKMINRPLPLAHYVT